MRGLVRPRRSEESCITQNTIIVIRKVKPPQLDNLAKSENRTNDVFFRYFYNYNLREVTNASFFPTCKYSYESSQVVP
jgi:hypothetical protein